MKGRYTNHVADFQDLYRGLSSFVSATKSADFGVDFVAPVHCDGQNSIKAAQTGLSRTLLQPPQHVEMVCVQDFPRGEVSVKVGAMEFRLYQDLKH